jgi:hypothetical protein
LGRHEEIEQWSQRLVNGSQEGLLLGPLKTVIANILPDDGAIFLLNSAFMPQAVIIFSAVAASCKRDVVIFTPGLSGVVDKFRTIITVKL